MIEFVDIRKKQDVALTYIAKILEQEETEEEAGRVCLLNFSL